MSGLRVSRHTLDFDSAIPVWDEAIPVGNGRIGCLLWGSSRELRLSLDRNELWDTTPQPETLLPEFTYAHLAELAKAGNIDEVRRIFDAPYNAATPSKLPAGKLIFHFAEGLPVRFFLDLERAEARVNVGKAELFCFHHASRGVGMVKLVPHGESFTRELVNPPFGRDDEPDTFQRERDTFNKSLSAVRYPAPILTKEEGFESFVQHTKNGFSYGIVCAFAQRGEAVEYAYTVACSDDGENWYEHAVGDVKAALTEGYDALLPGHEAWWREYWGRSEIFLPDTFMEKQWYFTMYLLASCSRKGSYPMPLQGVWTADSDVLPPWKGDYHNDLNTQMSYYPCCKANRLEQDESFLDFLWKLVPQGKAFAKSFFGVPGINLPAVMDLYGKPLGGWPQYSLSPTQQLWLAYSFDRHARYTGDPEFLREKAYPYMAGSMESVAALLEEGEDGLLRLPVSTTPEIHDDTQASWLTPNTNYDLALMRWCAKRLAEMARVLGNGEDDRWGKLLAKLPELAVDKRGVLMLSPDETLKESHRHLSHAMAIHPLRLLDYDRSEDAKVIDATILDLEQLGHGFWIGFSFTWMSEIYSVARNGEAAAWMLKTFWEDLCLPNGFHANGDWMHKGVTQYHYRPVTLESNMCAADALMEMLLYSERDTIEVFRAIPTAWKKKGVSFSRLRAEHGVLVSASVKNGAVEKVILEPERDAVVTFVSPWEGGLAAEGAEIVPVSGMPGRCSLRLKAGVPVTLTPGA